MQTCALSSVAAPTSRFPRLGGLLAGRSPVQHAVGISLWIGPLVGLLVVCVAGEIGLVPVAARLAARPAGRERVAVDALPSTSPVSSSRNVKLVRLGPIHGGLPDV
jgi:hypothetical protein